MPVFFLEGVIFFFERSGVLGRDDRWVSLGGGGGGGLILGRASFPDCPSQRVSLSPPK